MWLKFTKSIMILVFLSICLMVTGCVDEPTIEPVKRPFSVTRIGNFSQNVEAIKVLVYTGDQVQTFKVNKNTTTEYFDVASGKRRFVVYDEATNQLLFDKDIQFISYEESSVYFGGYYSTDILKNTFAPFYQAEGDTYVMEKPKDGKAYVYFADMSSDVFTTSHSDNTDSLISAKKFQITAVLTPTGKADTTVSFTKSAALEFGKLAGLELPAGTIKVSVVNNDNSSETLAKYEGSIEAGMRYFFYLNLTGNNTVVNLVPDKQAVLPVRQK
ncbi:MAG: hypothetical protein ACM34K_16245 [Bacillota bacterium]